MPYFAASGAVQLQPDLGTGERHQHPGQRPAGRPNRGRRAALRWPSQPRGHPNHRQGAAVPWLPLHTLRRPGGPVQRLRGPHQLSAYSPATAQRTILLSIYLLRSPTLRSSYSRAM